MWEIILFQVYVPKRWKLNVFDGCFFQHKVPRAGALYADPQFNFQNLHQMNDLYYSIYKAL